MFSPTNWQRIDLRKLDRAQTLERMAKEVGGVATAFRVMGGLLLFFLACGALFVAALIVPKLIGAGCQIQGMPGGADDPFTGIELATAARDATFTLVFPDGQTMIAGAGMWICSIVICLRASRMLRAIVQTKRPFDGGRVRNLMEIGQLLMFQGLVLPIAGSALTWALLRIIQYQGNLELSIIGPYQGCSIIVGLVLMAIARIFEYGCILQDQDDRLL